VGVVLRNSSPELTAVSATTLNLFNDMAAALRVTYTVPDTTLRYRALEFTVPLRNNLLPRS